MENPPLSRASTSDSSQPGPLPLFDLHLKILAESYLGFFQERKKIEEIYVDSLLRLHRRSKSLDEFLDDRSELSSARGVWAEVRDGVEREAQTRSAFLATLTTDVINRLNVIKDSQDRTRKRIKEDLKDSSTAYGEYAENVLPKLKRTYLKKCQEVEDHKQASLPPPSAPSAMTPTSAIDYQALTGVRSNPVMSSKAAVTAPQPLRPLERRPSLGAPRNRSPPASGLSDLAQHGKKQFGQLIGGFLEGRSGPGKELTGRPDNHAMRAVRAKREADEADKEYRKGVHWLETLRLKRIKTLENGYKSLEMFIYELAANLKVVLEKYTDNLTATTTTETQLSMVARSLIDRISPQKDTSKLAAFIPRSLALSIPKPVLYYNYNVGDSADLIFGVSLVDYATARGLPDFYIPRIVGICVKEIDARGLEAEGIYRVSGRHAVVQGLQQKIERNEREFHLNPLVDDVYAVGSLLKLYLRELPEPVFRYPLQERIQHTEEIADHKANKFMLLKSKIRRLPTVHQATLRALLEHLSRVIAFSDKNKMDPKNLAIVFGGVIFGEDEIPKPGDLLSVQAIKDTLMEDLITNAHIIFEESQPQQEHPLPPVPAGPVPNVAYGTSFTKVASVSGYQGSTEDFNPRMPSRPEKSIHPSSRGNPAASAHSDLPFSTSLQARYSRPDGGLVEGSTVPEGGIARAEGANLKTEGISVRPDGGNNSEGGPFRLDAGNPNAQSSPTRAAEGRTISERVQTVRTDAPSRASPVPPSPASEDFATPNETPESDAKHIRAPVTTNPPPIIRSQRSVAGSQTSPVRDRNPDLPATAEEEKRAGPSSQGTSNRKPSS